MYYLHLLVQELYSKCCVIQSNLDDDDYSVIDKIYLYVKDPNKAKYQYLIK